MGLWTLDIGSEWINVDCDYFSNNNISKCANIVSYAKITLKNPAAITLRFYTYQFQVSPKHACPLSNYTTLHPHDGIMELTSVSPRGWDSPSVLKNSVLRRSFRIRDGVMIHDLSCITRLMALQRYSWQQDCLIGLNCWHKSTGWFILTNTIT